MPEPPVAANGPPVRRVVAVLGDGGRTDAGRGLRALLGWARRERGVRATVVLLDDGPLAADLASVATVRLPPAALLRARRAAAAWGRPDTAEAAHRAWTRRARADAREADVVVAAGCAALPALVGSPAAAVPTVALLPDLGPAPVHPPELRSAAVSLATALDLVVTTTPAGAETAVRAPTEGGLGVFEERVRHHVGPVDPPPRHRPPADDAAALVVGCGPLGWTSGADLFVALAASIGPEVGGRQVHWTWLGRDDPDGTAAGVVDDIALRGVDGRVHLAGEVDDTADHLAAADLLVVTARADAHPIAAVEAALVGTPVAGFRPGTGLLADAGQDDRRVDALDVSALRDQVLHLLGEAETRRRTGAGQARAAARATTPLAAPALWSDISRAAGRRVST